MLQLLTPWQYSQMRGQHDSQLSESDEAFARQFIGAHQRILRAGGIVLGGTDEPLGLNIWGLLATVAGFVHFGGFTEYEALRTVTAVPAKMMGLEGRLGTVERGALADLLFVRGNPLERIQDLFNLEMVMKNGRLYTIDDLIEPYANVDLNSTADSAEVNPNGEAISWGSSTMALASAGGPSFGDEAFDYGADEHC